jgi:hypothetical protein
MDAPVISAQQLCDSYACPEGVDRFRQSFGEGAKIDPNNLKQWVGFHDVGWAILNLLTRDGVKIYSKHMTPHRPDDKRARASLMASYEDAVDAAHASHDPDDATSVAKYEGDRATAFANYEQQMNELDSSFRAKQGTAFVHAFQAQTTD